MSFERETYEVSEDIGDDNFALRVCINTFALETDTIITLTTVSGTAQGNLGYLLHHRFHLKPDFLASLVSIPTTLGPEGDLVFCKV